jgi:Tol biopolymer transport system component
MVRQSFLVLDRRGVNSALVLLAMGLAGACGSAGSSGGSGSSPGPTTTDTDSGTTPPPASTDAGYAMFGGGDSGSGTGPIQPTGPVTDFPQPVLDGTAPSNSPSLFGPITQGATSGGPCLVEPESDVVYPQNWLRPRFTWVVANGQNLFELRLHVANQIDDLVVYTTNSTWTMPQAMWDALRNHSPTEAMTLTVRGGVLSGGTLTGEALGTQTPMGVAPVQATGAIVYWTTNDAMTGGSALKGFSPGDDSVESVLTPTQYGQAQTNGSTCIGCHTSTPDGEYVAFTTTTAAEMQWSNGLALINAKDGTVGAAPSYVTPSGAQALARWNVGAMAFSPAHWSTSDHHAVVSYDNDNSGSNIVLSWLDVGAASPTAATGTIARNGDTQLAGAPTWSHDGDTIAYVSTNRVCTGRLGNCTAQYTAPQDVGSRADLYTVPYAAGAGGTATPVQGASDPSLQEYYPSFSPDDRWLAFNRAPNDDNLYDQPAAEVFVVPAAGGTPVRLAANDPPQCAGVTSPGITNSWAKWGPTALQANGSTYYWVVFSSKRTSSGTPQLYITSLVQGPDGTLTTHGAIYLWNQPSAEANHTPAWDTFQVAPITQ